MKRKTCFKEKKRIVKKRKKRKKKRIVIEKVILFIYLFIAKMVVPYKIRKKEKRKSLYV
jgi:hypothetical protein